MKKIALPIAALLVSLVFIASHCVGDDSVRFSELLDSDAPPKSDPMRATQPPSPSLLKAEFITQPIAPMLDASQPPLAITPPIVAGTIPEDPAPNTRSRHKQPSSAEGHRQKRSLFDRLLRRN